MYLNPFEAKFYIKELSIHLHYEWLAKSISKCVWDGCEGWVKSIFRNNLLTQLVREMLHLSGGQEISKTSGCGDNVFLLIHRNDQFALCIYITYHYKRQLINSKLETFASEYLNITMININSQHSPKCDLISFGLFGCFLSLYFFRTGINVKCKL